MAKKPGAGGVLLIAFVLAVITAYLIWTYLSRLETQSEANWKTVVVAVADIDAKTQISEPMVTLTRLPDSLIATNPCTDLTQVVGKITKDRIKAKDQIRQSDIVQEGEVPSLTYEIPPGMRAVAIGVDEVRGVGNTIQPGDHVDILATFTDPVAHMETTQMILQNVAVLAVDRGRTEADPKAGGASSSITLAVGPEDAELLTAANRTGVLHVALRPVDDNRIVASSGTRVSEILRGQKFFEKLADTNETRATPVIISPPPKRDQPEIKIYRGTQETTVRPE